MRKPDIDGLAGAAWRTPLERMEAFALQNPHRINPAVVKTTLSNWYLNGKGWHPFWSWWKVALLDISERTEYALRLPPAVRLYPEAEFNLVVVALRAGGSPPDVNGGGEPPIDRVELDYQFHGVVREAALDITTMAVTAICAGAMNPTTTSQRDEIDWASRLSRMVSDYHVGKFGGPRRHPLEVDPMTGRLTGRIAVEA